MPFKPVSESDCVPFFLRRSSSHSFHPQSPRSRLSDTRADDTAGCAARQNFVPFPTFDHAVYMFTKNVGQQLCAQCVLLLLYRSIRPVTGFVPIIGAIHCDLLQVHVSLYLSRISRHPATLRLTGDVLQHSAILGNKKPTFPTTAEIALRLATEKNED